MGKGVVLAAQVDNRLENLKDELQETFLNVLTTIDTKSKQLEEILESKFSELEAKLTHKYEEKFARLAVELKQRQEAVETLTERLDDISEELPFLEIRLITIP